MSRLKQQLLLGSVLVSLAACNNNTKPVKVDGNSDDILASHVDTTIRPQDDFFGYANGRWIKENPIPDDQKSWGIAYLVDEDLYERKKVINEQALAKPTDAIAQKIGAFWKSGMDTVAINKNGLAAIDPELKAIDQIKTKDDLLKVIADFKKKGIDVLFRSVVAQDDMNSEKMAFQLYQGGLGLPNRDYYFNTDERTKTIRAAYPGHIQKMFELTGLATDAQAKEISLAVVKFETGLAKASRKLEDLRDPYKNYNKFPVVGFNKVTPNFDWAQWLPLMGVNNLDTLIVGQPEFFANVNAALKATDIGVWKNYMRWCLINTTADYLGTDIGKQNFEFYGKLLSGAKAQKPRWKRVLDVEEGAIGEALGQLFVKEYFPAKTKKRYSDMVEDIREALKDRIKKLDWMSDSTKKKALVKLEKMKKKVGYPDKWKDFSAMEIKDQPYVRNVLSANQWWHNYEINKLGKPVNRDEWDMTPQTYNAYYNPSNNEIVLPAGIFTVPGMRDDDLDDALVYGYAAASTIGHEMTHGFDDQGRQYDENGNLKNWWTQEDELKFNQRAALMIAQFNNYIPVDSIHVNGKATLGENIADLGGVLLGWDAFTKKEQYLTGGKIDGFNPSQRFFMGWALGWLYNTRSEALAQQLLTDVHAPAKYRVNGPFADVDAFYKVFNVKPGDGMYLVDSLRVRIW